MSDGKQGYEQGGDQTTHDDDDDKGGALHVTRVLVARRNAAGFDDDFHGARMALGPWVGRA